MVQFFIQAIFLTIISLESLNCVREFVTDKCVQNDNSTLICNQLPTKIPAGIVNVKIEEFVHGTTSIYLTEDTFKDESWMNVTRLELKNSKTWWSNGLSFGPKCFAGLKILEELHINLDVYLEFQTDALVNVKSLKSFKLRDGRLRLDHFVTQLQNPEALTNLTDISMFSIGNILGAENRLNSTFFKNLGRNRNIEHITINAMQISLLDICAMLTELQSLKMVNFSFLEIEDLGCSSIAMQHLHIPDIIDLSYTKYSSKSGILPGRYVASSLSLSSDEDDFKYLLPLLKAQEINFSGILPQSSTTISVWLHNITYSLDEINKHILLDKEMNLKTLRGADNRLRYMDVKMVCNINKFSSVTNVDLSKNGLEMIHPSMFSCFPNLENIDLSENKLYRMFENNHDQFSQLLADLKQLRTINLASNNLTSLPDIFFENNSELEYINLSSNRLKQVHFHLIRVTHFQVLNIQANIISVLDFVSINNLNSIKERRKLKKDEFLHKPIMIMDSNLLSCSTCESKQFINWLLEKKIWSVDLNEIKCTNENGLNVHVNEAVISDLENICLRTVKIAVAVTCTVCIVIISVIFAIVILKWSKRTQRFQHRRKVLQNLAQGQGQFKFAAFLSYSSRDDDFVMQNILHQLNERLKETTGIDRDLVCTGDREFRPGRRIYDEVILCFRQTALVIVVVSENFCDSHMCQDELNLACAERKPIILMFKEHVDEALMTPNMQTLFRNNVRIVWCQMNGMTVVHPSWEKTCEAILDNIKLEYKQ